MSKLGMIIDLKSGYYDGWYTMESITDQFNRLEIDFPDAKFAIVQHVKGEGHILGRDIDRYRKLCKFYGKDYL